MRAEFAKKLGEAINNIGVITKDKKNPFYKSDYADINSILPNVKEELQKAGITCMAIVQNNSLVNVFIDQESGEVFPDINDNTIGLELKSIKAQERGSEITYYRRYLLCSNLLIEQADDDGNQGNKASGILPVMKEGTTEFIKAKKFIQEGGDIARVLASWTVSKEIETKLRAA